MNDKKYKIAVFGLGSAEIKEANEGDAFALGELIAGRGHYLITGLAKGVTQFASKGAKSKGGVVIGISPNNSEDEISTDVCYDNTDIIISTGLGDRGRNVISVRTCDGMIVINGSMGVLNEITNGVGENKPIVILRGSGGVADVAEMVMEALKPDYKYFSMVDDVKKAVDVLEDLITRKAQQR
ncbi:MAG TPA: hypothetical protein VL098_09445 [Flavipsychrobacter sp.]|nr:hypothetical protein [Flavipsychrobacter sp.]